MAPTVSYQWPGHMHMDCNMLGFVLYLLSSLLYSAITAKSSVQINRNSLHCCHAIHGGQCCGRSMTERCVHSNQMVCTSALVATTVLNACAYCFHANLHHVDCRCNLIGASSFQFSFSIIKDIKRLQFVERLQLLVIDRNGWSCTGPFVMLVGAHSKMYKGSRRTCIINAIVYKPHVHVQWIIQSILWVPRLLLWVSFLLLLYT